MRTLPQKRSVRSNVQKCEFWCLIKLSSYLISITLNKWNSSRFRYRSACFMCWQQTHSMIQSNVHHWAKIHRRLMFLYLLPQQDNEYYCTVKQQKRDLQHKNLCCYSTMSQSHSANQLVYGHPRFSAEFGKRSSRYWALTLWNRLLFKTKLSPTNDTFKCYLKTHLFTQSSTFYQRYPPSTGAADTGVTTGNIVHLIQWRNFKIRFIGRSNIDIETSCS